MHHPIQHPWVILAAIVGLLGTMGSGVAAYVTIKEDISTLQAGRIADERLEKQRYDYLKEDTEYMRSILDELRARQAGG